MDYNKYSKNYRKGVDSDRIISVCTAALRENPRDTEALYSRGYGYTQLGKIDLGIADFTAPSRLDPANHTYQSTVQMAQTALK